MGIQINGQTDTITATDGSFTIQGASGNLTGDLVGNVTGNLTGNVNSTGVTTVSSLRIGTGTSISSPATNVLTLGTNNSERLRIDSSGRVGVGTDIPGSYDSGGRTLVISENSTLAGMTIRSSNQGAIYFADGLTGNEAYRGRIEYSHSADSLNFGTAGTGSKLTLTSAGAVQIANGNLVFSTAGTGIDFSATSDGTGTVNDEVLAEYERGTWTPVLASLTGGTTPVITTSTASGVYVRIGAMVYIEFLMVVTAVTTQGTGNIGITGLPFTTNGIAYGNNIGITYNDIWDTAFREMYVTGSSLQIIPRGVTQSNAFYGSPANDNQSLISTGYFSAAGWYFRS